MRTLIFGTVAKTIIELHEGAISVASEGLGKGCTFTVEIPVYQMSSPLVTDTFRGISDRISLARDSLTRIYPSHDTYNTSDGSKLNLNVLIVDDSASNRKMLGRLIKDRVTSITEASDGLKAVSYVIHTSKLMIDVILMDFVMPNMDGPTATREIRSLGYNGLILGVTGNAHPDDIETFLNAGANRVLIKPVDTEELFSIIEGRSQN